MMNSETTCQLCQHLFSSPLILPCCSHSLCSSCLDTISYQKDNDPSKLLYNCPFCKKDSEESAAALPNNFLQDFIFHITKSSEPATIPCERCENLTKYDQIIICNECHNTKLCNSCSNHIHSVGKFKSHERSPFLQAVIHQADCLTDLTTCNTHLKEKIEYICSKDSTLLCSLCIPSHKQTCKASITTVKETYKDLQNQLAQKSERLKHQKGLLNKDSEGLKISSEELSKVHERTLQTVKDQFAQIQLILEYKQQELEGSITYLLNRRQDMINQELREIQDLDSWIENILSLVSFTNSYQNTAFIQGSKYLFGRIDTVLQRNSNRKLPSFDTNIFPPLNYIEETKATLYKISLLTASSPNEQTRSRPMTPKPSNNASRSNTPKANKPINYSTPNAGNSPSSRNSELTKSGRPRPSTKSQLDTSLTRINLPEKNEGKPMISQIQITNFTDDVDSPKFNTTYSSNQIGQNDDQEPMNLVKIKKKPARTPAPNSNLASYLNNLSANVTNPTPEHSSNANASFTQFIRTLDTTKKPRNSAQNDGTRHSKNSSISENHQHKNLHNSYDVQHISELQKNHQLKRLFTKTSSNATSISVAWTHPMNATNLLYQLEYGIGTKFQGIEQFKTVYKGPSPSFVIYDLMPKTSYRIRVCPITLKIKEGGATIPTEGEERTNSNSPSKQKREMFGLWSEVMSVTTKEVQNIDPESLGAHACLQSKGTDKIVVEFDKTGTVTASNGYCFGKVAWEVKFQQQAAHQSPDDSNSNIRIGVTNKQGKSMSVSGVMINYGLNAQSPTLKMLLDYEKKVLYVHNSVTGNIEVINNIPEGTLFPAFQNKTSRNAIGAPLKLAVSFELPTEVVQKVFKSVE